MQPWILAAWTLTTAGAADWHTTLYLGGGGFWRGRVRVVARNEGPRDAAGVPIDLRVGRGEGEIDLAGARAEGVRVCEADGTEFLFRITGPGGRPIERGPVPAGSTLTIPVVCPARGTATHFVYFDNPAAGAVPDFLDVAPGIRNGGLEHGEGGVPSGWVHDPGDDRHRTSWVTEAPHGGERCLKTSVAEGAEPTWIATRQRGIHIAGGSRYVMRAWVKARDVKGYAGWYIHAGDARNPMMIAPMLRAGGGTYDWKEVSAAFTAPAGADRADVGTVLRGTGTAWFDDVMLECETARGIRVAVARPERPAIREIGAGAPWPAGGREDVRLPVRVLNLSERPLQDALACADLSRLAPRLRGRLEGCTIRIVAGEKPVPHYRLRDWLLFEALVPARTAYTFHVYASKASGSPAGPPGDCARLLADPRNRVANPSFEEGEGTPAEWAAGGAEGARTDLDAPGRFGGRCARIHVPAGTARAWTGWRQRVRVQPGRRYLYAAWVRCEGIEGDAVRLHAHVRNAAGRLSADRAFQSVGPAVAGTTDWRPLAGILTMPGDAAWLELHLTMHAAGTVWHDGVVLAEVVEGRAAAPEAPPGRGPRGLVAWPVDAIVKVFREDLPPRRIPPARITAARNEREPLQLAVRSPEAVRGVRVEVEAPERARGGRLGEIEIGVVGYVPVDHESSYYHSDAPAWRRRIPKRAGGCDGWPGWWPDPILPRDTFDLEAGATQPLWITVRVPEDAAAGDYRGSVRLRAGRVLAAVPFTVHVWDFALPRRSRVAAIYDLRLGPRWRRAGESERETRHRLWRFMAEHRTSPDRIRPDPVLRHEGGRVVADFGAYDREAAYYFDDLGFPFSYFPGLFYAFGWGHPPRRFAGEAPYEGPYPYEGADRRRLRPAYKRAYQACLRVYWDHVKAKGWADRCVLYISDEPYDRLPHIREQMKALCAMIHEVDPAIPIYASTWHHQSAWDGSLDVWGIGHFGIVPPEKMAALRRGGARIWFTTDGHMCLDTPYCAIERLLPHYALRYGAEAYEFWGLTWLTYDPYAFGWHRYIRQSGEPGRTTWVRYPNGDGYLAYPGAPVGCDGPVTTVRFEQVREGVEDAESIVRLRALVERARAAGEVPEQAIEALERAEALVPIPTANGRYSTRTLPDPHAVLQVREAVARAIEALSAASPQADEGLRLKQLAYRLSPLWPRLSMLSISAYIARHR